MKGLTSGSVVVVVVDVRRLRGSEALWFARIFNSDALIQRWASTRGMVMHESRAGKDAETKKLTTKEVEETGRRFVVRELERRGAIDVAYHKEGRRTLLRASDARRTRRVTIRVKTKSRANWQASTDDIGAAGRVDDSWFWVLVDLAIGDAGPAKYFVMPDRWIRNCIKEHHASWLASHGGVRPVSPGSEHVAIEREEVEQWRGSWEVLKIF
jgi:hypothetical protein